jgi:hypothetical protein
MRRLITSLLAITFDAVLIFTSPVRAALPAELEPWAKVKVEGSVRKHPWLVGCNFVPSTAINQLEMWQADTFDLPTIDRELGWAEGLGFNVPVHRCCMF